MSEKYQMDDSSAHPFCLEIVQTLLPLHAKTLVFCTASSQNQYTDIVRMDHVIISDHLSKFNTLFEGQSNSEPVSVKPLLIVFDKTSALVKDSDAFRKLANDARSFQTTMIVHDLRQSDVHVTMGLPQEHLSPNANADMLCFATSVSVMSSSVVQQMGALIERQFDKARVLPLTKPGICVWVPKEDSPWRGLPPADASFMPGSAGEMETSIPYRARRLPPLNDFSKQLIL
jgi:hypothetical protein